jgi:hypothetical protein
MTPHIVDEVDDLARAKPSCWYWVLAALLGFPRKVPRAVGRVQVVVRYRLKRLFISWFLFAALVGVIAEWRGRDGVRWWLLSVFISPLLGLVLIGLLPPLKRPAGTPAPSAGQLALGAGVVQDPMVLGLRAVRRSGKEVATAAQQQEVRD